MAAKSTPSHSVLKCSQPGVVLPNCPPLEPAYVRPYLRRLLGDDERVDILATPGRCTVNNDLALLTLLLGAHCERVAYENIDITLKRPLASLHPDDCARRIAIDQRGGYCFLLVPAFCALLRFLGYKCSLHTAGCTPVLPASSERMGNHVVLLVHLESGSYIADVGLGEATRLPMRLCTHKWVEGTDEVGAEGVGFQYSITKVYDESIESNGLGRWEFTNDPSASFRGFSLDASTSAASVEAFSPYHR
eukprot:SAG31_NODE_2196_length_6219_cov_1.796569_1_plen_247_part_10